MKRATLLLVSLALPWSASGFLHRVPTEVAVPRSRLLSAAEGNRRDGDAMASAQSADADKQSSSTRAGSVRITSAWGRQARAAALAGLLAAFANGAPGFPAPAGWQPSTRAWAEESTPLVAAKPAAPLGKVADFNSGPAAAATPPGVDYPTEPTVEEAWQLLNKFYVDKAFKGQDWGAMRKQANAKVPGAPRRPVMAHTSGLPRRAGLSYGRAV